MVDDAKEEKKEKTFFKSTAKKAGELSREHKRFRAGGVANEGVRVTKGRNLARVANQRGR